MASLHILRLVLHVFAALFLTLSMAFALSAVLTTGWQTYYDSGSMEIHQHGLWFDYTYAKRHVSGKENPEWSWKYKFGTAVIGDDQHLWAPYQYNTLILLTVAAFLAFVLAILGYMAPYSIAVAVVWTAISIWPPFLALAGVILFFTTASLPDYNHIFTDRRVELEISYSFYFAVVAAVLFSLAFAFVIGSAILDIMLLRRGERPSLRDTYLKVSTKATVTKTTTTTQQVQEKQSTTV